MKGGGWQWLVQVKPFNEKLKIAAASGRKSLLVPLRTSCSPWTVCGSAQEVTPCLRRADGRGHAVRVSSPSGTSEVLLVEHFLLLQMWVEEHHGSRRILASDGARTCRDCSPAWCDLLPTSWHHSRKAFHASELGPTTSRSRALMGWIEEVLCHCQPCT